MHDVRRADAARARRVRHGDIRGARGMQRIAPHATTALAVDAAIRDQVG
jgi:hypothetical protein